MASNATLALQSFDAVVARLEAIPPNTNASPFRIEDYTRAAAQLDATILHLISLLESFDQKVGFSNLAEVPSHIQPVAADVRTEAETLVNHIYHRLLIIAVILVCGTLGAVILHARLRGRCTN